MARPTKAGLEYFSMDCDFDEDDKNALIEAKFGAEGFRVIVKLFSKIYSTNGYWYRWTEEEELLFIQRKVQGLTLEQLRAIVSYAIEKGLFDKERYEKYQILTSHGIQKRYDKVSSKRKDREIYSELWLLDADDINADLLPQTADPVIPEKTPVNPAETSVNDDIKDTSGGVNFDPCQEIGKKEIGNRKYGKGKGKPKTRPKSLDELLPEQLEAWRLSFPKLDIGTELQLAKNWTSNKGRSHKDAKAFFENWLIKADKDLQREPWR